ncbi:hypothetical protein V5N11_004883 [Cardamine amara subsp. amara]|uniref:Aspartic peptidase DDI1-type domain-containing protein n=1 Tax=Cardamine amara subsp. amara TaxID=228776 RepID=A0ABD1AZC1_CARAN
MSSQIIKHHQRMLHKRENSVKLIFPYTIKGMNFLDSLCDTGASANMMSNTIAIKLKIVDIKPSTVSIKLGDAFNKNPRGSVQNLIVQVGGCLVPVDFNIIGMSERYHTPLIFEKTFLDIVHGSSG